MRIKFINKKKVQKQAMKMAKKQDKHNNKELLKVININIKQSMANKLTKVTVDVGREIDPSFIEAVIFELAKQYDVTYDKTTSENKGNWLTISWVK
jgi:hypothetical protein